MLGSKRRDNEEIMDIETKMNRVMIPTMIAMMVFMFLAFIISAVYQNKYMTGMISQEKWQSVFGFVIGIMILNVFMPIVVIGIMTFVFYVQRLKFEKYQMSLNTFEGPILFSPYKWGVYQFQTQTSAYTKLVCTEMMKISLENTRAFNTLYNHIKSGHGIVEIDQTQLFKQMEEDIGDLKNDDILQKELKKIFDMNENDTIDLMLPNEVDFESNDDYQDELNVFEKYRTEKENDLDKKKIDSVRELIKKNNIRISKKDISLTPEKELEIDDGSNASNNERVIKIRYDILLKFGLMKKVSNGKWQMGFRYLESMKCLDDPEEEESYYDEVLKEDRYKDPILNSEAICYIIPDSEDEVFSFSNRLTNDINAVEVSKCYVTWKFLGWIIEDKVPLLMYLNSTEAMKIWNLQLSGNTIHDAKLMAHIQLTYMAYNDSESLHNTISALRADVSDYKTQISKIRHEKIDKWISRSDVTSDLRKRIKLTMKKLDTTPIIFGVLMLIVGLLMGFSIKSRIGLPGG